MTDAQRRCVLDIDAHPYDITAQPHTPQTIGECVAHGWIIATPRNGYAVTSDGVAALAVTA
jgi:hypothetical protein